MKILPDGTVQITNKNNGTTKIVKPEDLPSYGIPYSKFESELSSFKGIGGQTLLNNPEEEKKILSNKVAQEDKNKKVSEAAQNYLDTYTQLASKGDLTSDEAKRQLSFAAGKYNTIAGFGEGGKVLSAAELGILAPTLIKTERQRGQNIIEKMSGAQPEMTKGLLQEAPETAAKKMVLALQATNPDLASKYQNLPISETPTGNALTNAPGNVKNIINSILGLPGNIVEQANQMEQGPGGVNSQGGYDPLQRLLQTAKMTIAPEVGYVQNLNKDIGQPLQGGDILGRAGENFNQRPISTILDLLPFLSAGKSALLNKISKAPEATSTEALGEVNPIQNLIRKTTDVVSGGGSKEYIARAATSEKALPQNQVLLEENILSKPTATGKITATSKSMQKYGSQIGDIYKANTEPVMGADIGKILDTKLSDAGYDAKAIGFIKKYINKQGNFDLESGDAKITQERLWTAAKKIEEAPPKTTNNTENPVVYKQLSQDAGRIIRDFLGEKNPQVKPLNARYGALADYMYNVLKNPEGISAKGGIYNNIAKGAKVSLDALLNLLYKGSSLNK